MKLDREVKGQNYKISSVKLNKLVHLTENHEIICFLVNTMDQMKLAGATNVRYYKPIARYLEVHYGSTASHESRFS